MKTLTIEPRHYDTGLKMKGLSIKAAGNAGRSLCRDYNGGYYISNEFHPFYIDGKTAKIRLHEFIKYLKELHAALPFDRITIYGNYEKTGEELMKLILNDNQ